MFLKSRENYLWEPYSPHELEHTTHYITFPIVTSLSTLTHLPTPNATATVSHLVTWWPCNVLGTQSREQVLLMKRRKFQLIRLERFSGRNLKERKCRGAWHPVPGWRKWVWVTMWSRSGCYLMIALHFYKQNWITYFNSLTLRKQESIRTPWKLWTSYNQLTQKSRVLAQKITVTQLVKKLPAFYRTMKSHYCAHKTPSLTQMHPVHTSPHYFH
jgi:hypothetical protein